MPDGSDGSGGAAGTVGGAISVVTVELIGDGETTVGPARLTIGLGTGVAVGGTVGEGVRGMVKEAGCARSTVSVRTGDGSSVGVGIGEGGGVFDGGAVGVSVGVATLTATSKLMTGAGVGVEALKNARPGPLQAAEKIAGRIIRKERNLCDMVVTKLGLISQRH